MTETSVFVVCEFYFKEAQAALTAEGLTDAIAVKMPARCGRPPLGQNELAEILSPFSENDAVILGCRCCLADFRDFHDETNRIQLHQCEMCFDLVAPVPLVRHCIDKGAFLVTPGWLAEWPAAMKRLGLDKETAREMFAETVRQIMLLDTGVDDQSARHLEEFAAYAGREFTALPIDTSRLQLLFVRTAAARRLAGQNRVHQKEMHDLQKQSATYAMAIDLLSDLSRIVDEAEAIAAMLDVYAMLFAPQKIYYLRYEAGRPSTFWSKPELTDSEGRETVRKMMADFQENSGYLASGRGFYLRVVRRGEVRAVVAVDEILLPEHLDQYLNLALSIVNISILPIENARKYNQVQKTEQMLREVNDELIRLATTDALTCIANRRAYDEYIEVEWRRMLREKSSLALVLCDIDFFKNYNDRYGHGNGDICLYTVAQILRRILRRPGDILARYGGEEFIAVLPSTTIEGALIVAEQMRLAVAEYGLPHEGSAAAPYVTISLGIAQISADQAKQVSPADLFQAADAALYKAKQQGRNRSVVYRETA